MGAFQTTSKNPYKSLISESILSDPASFGRAMTTAWIVMSICFFLPQLLKYQARINNRDLPCIMNPLSVPPFQCVTCSRLISREDDDESDSGSERSYQTCAGTCSDVVTSPVTCIAAKRLAHQAYFLAGSFQLRCSNPFFLQERGCPKCLHFVLHG
jgi:hypothetical protein